MGSGIGLPAENENFGRLEKQPQFRFSRWAMGRGPANGLLQDHILRLPLCFYHACH